MNHAAIKILLVEDSPGDVRLIHESLKSTSHGEFALTHAERLAEALQRLDAEPFDAVLLDLSLPDAEGLEAVRQGAQDYILKMQMDIESYTLVRTMRRSRACFPGKFITMLIGLMLMNFPGKHALERRIVQQPVVLRMINWMRQRAGRPRLELPVAEVPVKALHNRH